MILLIDGDSLLYKVGFSLEDKISWDNTDTCDYYSNIQQQFTTIKSSIEAMLFATGCDSYEMWLTGSNNFRHNNPLGYKANRDGIRKPTDFRILFKRVVDELGANVAQGYEADDAVVYLKNNNIEKYVLSAIDKDVLYQSEGVHYNFNKDNFVTVTRDEAIQFKYYQTLAGDASDGYKGVPRIGNVKAKKILEGTLGNERLMWVKTLLAFRGAGLRYSDAINTMRLADMWQYDGEKINLFNPLDLKKLKRNLKSDTIERLER